MLVIFKNTWFAPTEIVELDRIRSTSGKRYRKASEPQYVPDELFKYLPKSAVVVEGPAKGAAKSKPVKAKVEPNPLHEADAERANAEALPDDLPDYVKPKDK